MSHQDTLKVIERIASKAGKEAGANDDDRRRFQRRELPCAVAITLFDAIGEIVGSGRATLFDYSPDGAALCDVALDGPAAPDISSAYHVGFRVDDGPLGGIEAGGKVVRAGTGVSSLALRFDCFYVSIDQ